MPGLRSLFHAAALLGALAVFALAPQPAAAQAVNQITQISPNSAAQGTVGLRVSFTLDSDAPPAPPAGIMPTSVTLGTMSGSSVTHASQYLVTAVFTIPANEPVGAKDPVIVFPLPTGTLTYSMSGGFTATSGQAGPPTITTEPAARSVCAGSSVSFTVAALGEPPLSYQWQKDGGDIGGATSATLAIAPVALGDAGSYRCVVTNGLGKATSNAAVLSVAAGPCSDAYAVVDTGQSECYDASGIIACPAAGAAYHGQDSQHAGTPNIQWTDAFGSSGTWYYDVRAYNANCPAEGPQ